MLLPLPRSAAVLAAAILAALPAHAQEPAGVLDMGLSAGFARTSRWYEGADGAGTLSGGPAFSLDARLWPVPAAGLRLQVGTFGTELRTTRERTQRMRGTTYDVSAVFRPLAGSRVAPALASAYVFAGGGALALSGPRDSVTTCDGDRCDVVLRVGPTTVPQFTAGAGTELPVGDGFSLFAEASLAAYQSPAEAPSAGLASLQSSPTGPGAFSLAAQPAAAAGATTSGGSLTSRFVFGVRRAFRGRNPPPPTPPPAVPPPPAAPAGGGASPTTGGYVEVRTAAPGAEVYLVPRTVVEDNPAILCRLRPVYGGASYFRGRTTAAAGVRAYASPRTWVVVVRQGGREFQDRVQLAAGRVRTFTLDLRTDGTPYRCPR